MPDPFFASSSRKRKRSTSAPSKGIPKKKAAFSNGKSKPKPSTSSTGGPSRVKKRVVDEELSDATDDAGGVDDMELMVSDEEPYQSGSENEDETPAEKRLRLAQLYLDGVKNSLGDGGDFDAAEIDKELISARLKQDVMEHAGKVHLFVADKFDFTQPPKSLRTRGHRFTVTTAVASEDVNFLYTAGKEGSVIKWNLRTGKKVSVAPKQRQQKGKQREDVNGHTDEIWALALSTDGKFLASGGKDRKVGVWNVESEDGLTWVKGFAGHRDSISCLAFRKASHQLYSGSHDRTLKMFDLAVMGYVETLFGHQDFVLSVDSLRGETAVSCGGRDRTVRFWKIVDETQLVFRGGGRSKMREVLEGGAFEGMEDEDEPKKKPTTTTTRSFIEGSMECVAMIDEETFLSGGDSGSISLWTTQKKKPVFTQALAHGLNETVTEDRGVVISPRWITALGSLRYSDIIASGSWDGQIRLWKLDAKLRSFSLIGCLAAPGVVNSLQLLSLPREVQLSWDEQSALARPTSKTSASMMLVAGMGQESRMGRWVTVKEPGSFNGCLTFVFHQRTSL